MPGMDNSGLLAYRQWCAERFCFAMNSLHLRLETKASAILIRTWPTALGYEYGILSHFGTIPIYRFHGSSVVAHVFHPGNPSLLRTVFFQRGT